MRIKRFQNNLVLFLDQQMFDTVIYVLVMDLRPKRYQGVGGRIEATSKC